MSLRISVARLMSAALTAAAASPAGAQTLVDNLVSAAAPQPFSADDLLWMEVRTADLELADTMNVYASRAGVFVPLGEFSRILDLAVGVFPSQQRAEGWVLSQDRRLVVDLASRTARIGGRVIAFAPGQAAIFEEDLFLRADLIEQLLPVRLTADVSAQVLTVEATEALPFQQRLERELRRSGLRPGVEVASRRLATPYRAFSRPAFDVNVGGQLTRDGDDQSRSYDIRMAGDLAHAGFQGFLGSNQDGEIDNIRLLLERKDPGGRALGLLGATRAGIGDVFTPSMPIGAASFSGRGAFYSSAPLENLDLATPLNLRGELAVGEEVELYVNEVLRAAQSSPVQGRYEFLDVPLTFGLNTIRLVFYGSQGQTREEVRRVNFGAGQVEAGRFVLRMGAVQQGVDVIDVGEPNPQPRRGEARFIAMADYGVSSALTLSVGAAHYTPEVGAARTMGLAGVRAGLGPIAAQADVAFDDQGGSGANLGAATRAFGVSLAANHAEFRGGFVDETRQLASDALLRRATKLRAEAQAPFGAVLVPISLDYRRNERVDGTWIVNASLASSAPIGRYYVSTRLDYEQDRALNFQQERLLGSADVATLVVAGVQLRGGLAYEVTPGVRLDSAYATADFQINEKNTLRIGAIRSFGDNSETSLQASHLYRAANFDIAANAAYETTSGEWRLGLQLGFALAYDPVDRRYRLARPGASTGGGVALNAYVDADGDGRRGRDEAGASGVLLETPAGPVVTDEDGRALIYGLGDAAWSRVRVNTEGVEDPFLSGGPGVFEFVPRPGGMTLVDYPMAQTAELEIIAKITRAAGDARPLSALNIQLVPVEGGDAIDARTDHAGVAFFEGVRPGAYEVRLDPAQAGPLGLRAASLTVTVPPNGGYLRGGELIVTIAPETMQ